MKCLVLHVPFTLPHPHPPPPPPFSFFFLLHTEREAEIQTILDNETLVNEALPIILEELPTVLMSWEVLTTNPESGSFLVSSLCKMMECVDFR